MSQIRRRVAVAGAVLLGLATSVGAAGPAAAEDPPTNPSYVTSWLALSTGPSNTVRLVDASTGATTTTQTLTTSTSCAMNQGGKALVEFTPSAGAQGVGLSAGSIGVREKKNAAGTSCSAVDFASKESLTLTLQGGVGGLVAASASLDINLKQSAQILATARKGGTAVGLYELRSGTTITAPQPVEGDPPRTVFTCNNPADSGPDSGTSNNCRWEISAPSWTSLTEDGVVFDSLELKAYHGSFSLMGGADGVVDDPTDPMPAYFGSDQDASILELVDGTLFCQQIATLPVSPTVPKSEWKRLDNLDSSTCVAYPYSASTGVENGKSFAEFVKPLDFQPNSQALWVTTGVYTGSTIPTPTMDLDGISTDDGGLPLDPCDPTWYDDSGAFIGPESTDDVSSPFACLVSAEKGKGGGSTKTAVFSVYVFGDAKLGW
jgi:hypothetical protein